jgi:CRISPR-associated endonuclease Csn1
MRLSLHEIGRALFHLNQRRGFQANRLTDSDDAEGGAMSKGMADLRAALEKAGARTLGEFLAQRHARDREGFRLDGSGRRVSKANDNLVAVGRDEGVRFRPRREGAKVLYDLYPTRAMVEHELDEIWKRQSGFHPELTTVLLGRLKRIIIAQRPLRKPLVGRCTFRPEEERAPRALPLFQRFRILSEIAALEVERPGRPARKLSLQDRDALAALLSSQTSTVTFEKVRRALKLSDDARLNLERGGRKGLDPDKTAAVLAKTGKGESFGKRWRGYERKRQDETAEKLLTEPDEDKLLEWLRKSCGLAETAALAASAARLPQGHGHIGRSMLAELVNVMETESAETTHPDTGEVYRRPLIYDEAVARLGLHHSNLEAGRHARLPYYGEAMARQVISNPRAAEGSQEKIGRVPNPTVHIGLNQMRAVVNALVDAYGPPDGIVLELARELKQNREQKDSAARQNRENEAANERRRQELAALGHPDTHGNRLLLRLYDELPADERVCVYSGTPISMGMLLQGQIDIDHILPRSRTLDDGFANKVLCTRERNRFKGNRAPAEAWSADELREIAERAERLFRKKAWRFAPDAMEKFEEKHDFLARHLTDSQHMARLAKDYLGHLYGTEERNRRVWSTPGRLTSMLRGMWGLNGLLKDHNRRDEEDANVKTRDDHRHHLLDAFVVACTDRGLLQRIATASGRAERLDLHRWAAKGEFPEPFPRFREQLGEKLDRVVISHKPDHGPEGQFHETA